MDQRKRHSEEDTDLHTASEGEDTHHTARMPKLLRTKSEYPQQQQQARQHHKPCSEHTDRHHNTHSQHHEPEEYPNEQERLGTTALTCLRSLGMDVRSQDPKVHAKGSLLAWNKYAGLILEMLEGAAMESDEEIDRDL